MSNWMSNLCLSTQSQNVSRECFYSVTHEASASALSDALADADRCRQMQTDADRCRSTTCQGNSVDLWTCGSVKHRSRLHWSCQDSNDSRFLKNPKAEPIQTSMKVY